MATAAAPAGAPTSAASSARSTSASGTATWPTSPTTGCCACAGPATCCSRREGSGGGAVPRRRRGRAPRRRTCVLDEAHVGRAADPGRPGVLLPAVGPRRGALPAGVLPRTGRRDRVGARPAAPGPASSRPTRSLDQTDARRRGGAAASPRRRASPATWCRSTSATSWSGSCAASWTGLGGGAEVWDRIARVLRRAGPPRPRGPALGRGMSTTANGPATSRPPCPTSTSAAATSVADRYAAGPTVVLRMRATETTGVRVHAVALRCQVRVEPRRRVTTATARPTRSSTCSATGRAGARPCSRCSWPS